MSKNMCNLRFLNFDFLEIIFRIIISYWNVNFWCPSIRNIVQNKIKILKVDKVKCLTIVFACIAILIKVIKYHNWLTKFLKSQWQYTNKFGLRGFLWCEQSFSTNSWGSLLVCNGKCLFLHWKPMYFPIVTKLHSNGWNLGG